MYIIAKYAFITSINSIVYKNQSSNQVSRVTAKTSLLHTKETVTSEAKWREHGVKQVVSVQDVFRFNLEINPILFWGF